MDVRLSHYVGIAVFYVYLIALSDASACYPISMAAKMHNKARCLLLLGGLNCGISLVGTPPVRASTENTVAVAPKILSPASTMLAGVETGSSSVLPLETAVLQLESCTTRECTALGLANLYESAGAEVTLARDEYKYRIVTAVNQQRASLGKGWDSTLRYEAGEVKRRADPFRTVDLAAYLSVAPYVGGACYLAALLVQKVRPGKFVFAYPAAVAVFLCPIVFTVLSS